MSAADPVVGAGGMTFVTAECADRLPPKGDFARILRESPSVDALMDANTAPRLDCWSAQVVARVLLCADVAIFSEGLSNEELALARVHRVDDLGQALEERLDEQPEGCLCVLPRAPLTLASTVQ